MVFARPDRYVIPPGTSRVLDLWNRVCDQEIGHCSVFLKANGVDIYAELQVWHSAFTTELFTCDFVDELITQSPYSKIIQFDLPVDLRPYRPRLGVTCVSVAKHALGIDAPMVLTPKQLFRHLVSLPGCKQIERQVTYESSGCSPEVPT